jgi:hypothetical protein
MYRAKKDTSRHRLKSLKTPVTILTVLNAPRQVAPDAVAAGVDPRRPREARLAELVVRPHDASVAEMLKNGTDRSHWEITGSPQ